MECRLPSRTDIAPMTTVLTLLSGAITTQVVSAGVSIGLPDHLTERPRNAEDLARVTDVALPNFLRLARAWAAFGLLAIDEAGDLLQTPLTPLLRTDTPGSLCHRSLELGHPDLFRVFEGLGAALLDGGCAFETAHKRTMYELFADRPVLGRMFVEDLSENSRGIGDELARAYDLSGATSVADIGGGDGRMLSRLLRAWPHLHGTLFERAETRAAAQKLIETEGMADRCAIVVGDFFAGVPAGHDVYLLKYVLQDWDDVAAAKLLRACRAAMSSSSRLLILEQLVPDRPTPTPQSQSAVLDDLLVFSFTGGGNRTMSELAGLIHAAGLTIRQPVARLPQVDVVECGPA